VEVCDIQKADVPEGDPFDRIGAEHYDSDAQLMARRYKSAHRIQNELVCSSLSHASCGHLIVLDLGCGTGSDGIQILSNARNALYLGVDCSDHMLVQAEDKCLRQGLRKRCHFVRRDIRLLTLNNLLESSTFFKSSSGIACVITALVLHHYRPDEKRKIYRFSYDILPKDGLFVLTDLYLNSLKCCADQALRRELADVRNTIKRLGVSDSDRHTTICERHYIEDNQPQILLSEIALLNEVGFGDVDIVFRSGQLAVLAAGR
jgi:SAM-dependent methyltransferase